MKFLIVRTSAFGDIIQTYPVLEYLKARYPDCTIDWVVEARMKEIVEAHPLVDRTIVIDSQAWRKSLCLKGMFRSLRALRATKYDVLFDLQSNVKSSFCSLFARAKKRVGFGCQTAHESISALFVSERIDPPAGLNIRQEYLYIVQKHFNDFSEVKTSRLLNLQEPISEPTQKWMVCPGSNWKNKQMTPEALVGFLDECQRVYGARFLFLCGSDAEREFAESLVAKFTGSGSLFRPKLAMLQNLMAKMQLVITMDSLPLHLAASANVPTFSFFGPSSSQKFAPNGPLHGSFQGACPYGESFVKRCSKLRSCPTGACLREAQTRELFQNFAAWHNKIFLAK